MTKKRWWLWCVGVIDLADEFPYAWTGIVAAKSAAAAKKRARARVLELALSESAWDPDEHDRTWTIDDYDDVIHRLRKKRFLVGDAGEIRVVELPPRLAEGVL